MAKKVHPHTALVNAVDKLASLRKDVFGWPNNTGEGMLNGKRWVRFGFKGSADWIGLSADGRMLCLECKTGDARQTFDQRMFQEEIEKRNGRYFIVRSVEDAQRAFDSANLKAI